MRLLWKVALIDLHSRRAREGDLKTRIGVLRYNIRLLVASEQPKADR